MMKCAGHCEGVDNASSPRPPNRPRSDEGEAGFASVLGCGLRRSPPGRFSPDVLVMPLAKSLTGTPRAPAAARSPAATEGDE